MGDRTRFQGIDFPQLSEEDIEILDRFAAKAIPALIAKNVHCTNIGELAYKYAVSLLKERARIIENYKNETG